MPKYKVTLAGTRYCSAEVEVNAADLDSAEQAAVDMAGSLEWGMSELETVYAIEAEVMFDDG